MYKLWNSKFKGTDNLDDGDNGGSRQLLWALDYTKKQNTCIFLVRYYSGKKNWDLTDSKYSMKLL